MQTTYGAGRRKNRSNETERKKCKDNRQLLQLLLCIGIFLTVFIGKGVCPSRVAQTGGQVLQIIRANTDFRSAFTGLGVALSGEESVLGGIGEFCVSVFAPTHQDTTHEEVVLTDGSEGNLVILDVTPQTEQQETPLNIGDVVQETQARDLPDGYSGEWLYLGTMQTATPVFGTVTSEFGYRDHPTKGRYAAHGGIDIAANRGTSILAFAEGIVAEVGMSEDFGRFVHIEHPNGVSTFYSHCDTILVQTGEEVSVGQSIAQVGSTGQSTGAHLHFEVRLNGIRLDPMFYIAPMSEV